MYFNWNGFYIGANGGYSFGYANTSVTGLTPVGAAVNVGVNPKGWLGGGQIGYNWQGAGSPWVFGLETDFQVTGETDTGTCTAPACVPNANVKNSYPYFGTFRGRIGWDPSQWLFYITAGLAYAETSRAVNQLGVVSFQETPLASASRSAAALNTPLTCTGRSRRNTFTSITEPAA